MRKFIALENDIYYSIEQDGDVIKFYGHKKDAAYHTRKDVTPAELPNKIIINEIIERPTLSSEISDKLQSFLGVLAENFNKGA